MRKRTYTDDFNNQEALYKANNQPVLNDAQINDAKLVKKLPSDFPIANWESMNTKAQLKAMQHSGLSDKEQWALLNTTAPLSALNQHNQAQNAVETRATAAKIATTLMSAAAQAAIPRPPVTASKPANSTPLQTTTQQGKLDTKQKEYETRFYENAIRQTGISNTLNSTTKAPTAYKPQKDNAQPKNPSGDGEKKESWIDKIASWWNKIFSPEEKQEPTKVVTINIVPPSPTPRITPSPSPKPTATPTPKPTANVDMISQLVEDERKRENPFFMKYSQNSGDRSDCSTQIYDLYSMKGENNPLLGSQHETCQMYYELLHIPPKSFIESGGVIQSNVPRDVAKGAEPVPTDWQKKTEFGDMVIWKENPKYYSDKSLINKEGEHWHIGLCVGNGEMFDRGQWEENNPNGFEEGLFVRGLDTVKTSYVLMMIIKPGEEARLTINDLYSYLSDHR